MKKIIVITSLLFTFLSCDRFEHEIYQNAEIEVMFGKFTDAISSQDTLSIISFFDENYKHYGDTLATANSRFVDYVSRYDTLTTNLDNYYQDLSINWTLSGKISLDDIEFQKIKSFSDYLISNNNSEFEFYGNQLGTPPPYDPTKPMVVIQFSTATTCGNCPDAALKLAELKREYGGQLVYLDYASDGPNQNNNNLDVNWIELASYYPEVSLSPSSVFQGQSIITGSGEYEMSLYETRCEEFANEEKIVHIDLIADFNLEIISGTATISNFHALPREGDLKLEIAVVQKHSDLEYHINGQELHNIVIATQTLDLTSPEINFEINIGMTIDDNIKLVVWVQTKEEPYNNETCKIYDAQIYDFEN